MHDAIKEKGAVLGGEQSGHILSKINNLNPETKIMIDQTIELFQKIYSDNCRVYIRPSGTEPVMRVLVEAKNHKEVNSLSSEITNKLFLEINKIIS